MARWVYIVPGLSCELTKQLRFSGLMERVEWRNLGYSDSSPLPVDSSDSDGGASVVVSNPAPPDAGKK